MTSITPCHKEQRREAYELMLQLRPKLTFREFEQTLDWMEENYKSFQLLGAWQGEELVGLMSFFIRKNLVTPGSFAVIDDLVVHEKFRRKHVGSDLIEYAIALTKECHAAYLWLESGFQRLEAHAFYETRGFMKHGYSFIKLLS